MKISEFKDKVKILGRCVEAGEMLLLPLSGCGVEFEYVQMGQHGEGSVGIDPADGGDVAQSRPSNEGDEMQGGPVSGELSVTLVAGKAADVPDNEENYARIAVYADDVRVVCTQLTSRRTVLRIPTGDGEKHIIRILKLSEVAMSIVCIESIDIPATASISPTAGKNLKIEFIGDSITCGYGVDDEDPLHLFKTATEDVTKAYAYKAAMKLNADYSLFSASGYGIISGYTDDPEKRVPEELIPPYYKSLGLTYDLIDGVPATQDISWDFSRFIPDVIVINLGTNDESYCQDDQEKLNEYAGLYTEFLKEVRALNPGAYIVCTLGLMGDALFPYVEKAVADYTRETGDTRITAARLTPQDPEKGYVCDYHPLESAHEKAAEEIVGVIRTIS